MLRIRSHTVWSSLNSIEKSSGLWVEKYRGVQSESVSGRSYQSVVLNDQGADEILSHGSTAVLSLYNTSSKEIKLAFKSLVPFFMRSQAITVSYQLDDGEAKEINVDQSLHTIKLKVPKGRHSLKIMLSNAPLYHRLWLSLLENNKLKRGMEKSRRFELSSAKENLVYAVKGPLWIKIDKRINNRISTHQQYIPVSQKKLILFNKDDQDYAYYRVSYRDIKPAIKKKYFYKQNNSTDVKTFITSNENINNISPPKIISLIDRWQLGKQEDGTLTYSVSQVARDLVAGELTRSADEYFQMDMSYRIYNQLSDQWFYLSALARFRNQENSSFGVKSRLRGHFDFIPVDWSLDARLFTQKIDSGQAWSSQIKLVFSQARKLNQHFYHLPKVQFSRRILSDNTPSLNSRIDQDVFSNYKIDHISSLRLSDTFVYRPYRDVEMYIGAERISNSRWSEIDQLRGRVGWRLLVNNIRWDINARQTQFKVDSNRSIETDRNILQMRVLLEKWIKPRYRLELSASLERDMNADDKTLFVQLSLHQSEGRSYIDYSPAELLFRDLRQAKLSPELNNELN